MRNGERITESILIGKEAYFFLRNKQRVQRGRKPLSKECEDNLWERVIHYRKDGKCPVTDYSFGGGDGTYEGKWTSWTVKMVKQMLDRAGLEYEDGGCVEYLEV